MSLLAGVLIWHRKKGFSFPLYIHAVLSVFSLTSIQHTIGQIFHEEPSHVLITLSCQADRWTWWMWSLHSTYCLPEPLTLGGTDAITELHGLNSLPPPLAFPGGYQHIHCKLASCYSLPQYTPYCGLDSSYHTIWTQDCEVNGVTKAIQSNKKHPITLDL